jgi:hypothetical protein
MPRLSVALAVAAAVVLVCRPAAAFDGLVFGEDPRKPVDVDDALVCHACNAAVVEMTSHVRAAICRHT